MPHQDKDRWGGFNRTPKTEPIRKRYFIQVSSTCFTKIERHNAEAAGVQKKVGCTNGMLDIPITADPHNSFQPYARILGGSRMKLIMRINYGAHLTRLGGLREYMQQASGTTRGAPPYNFSYGATL
jgi:hypothetical protein